MQASHVHHYSCYYHRYRRGRAVECHNAYYMGGPRSPWDALFRLLVILGLLSCCNHMSARTAHTAVATASNSPDGNHDGGAMQHHRPQRYTVAHRDRQLAAFYWAEQHGRAASAAAAPRRLMAEQPWQQPWQQRSSARNHLLYVPPARSPSNVPASHRNATAPDDDDDEIIDPRYGVDKRLVPTGPNPLHN